MKNKNLFLLLVWVGFLWGLLVGFLAELKAVQPAPLIHYMGYPVNGVVVGAFIAGVYIFIKESKYL